VRLTAKFTRQEAIEVRRIDWSQYYYLCLVNNYMWPRFFPFMGVLLVGEILTLWIAHKAQVAPIFVGSAVGTVGIAYLLYLLVRWHQFPQKLLDKINADMPESIEIDDAGLLMRHNNGVTDSIPWSVVKSWRSGNRAVILYFAQRMNMLPLPLQQLSPEQQEILRNTLRQHLGEPIFSLPQEISEAV